MTRLVSRSEVLSKIWLTLLCAIVYIAALVIPLGRKVDDPEKRDRYIMSHLGELDDRFDELKSECNENMDTIRRLEDEVNRLKRGSNETEGVRAGQRFQKPSSIRVASIWFSSSIGIYCLYNSGPAH